MSQVYRSCSNQWGVGIALRRSTIYDTWRWVFYINHGFRSWSYSWKKNPKAPQPTEAKP